VLGLRRNIDAETASQRIDKYFYDDWEKVIAKISAYADLVPFLLRLKTASIRLAVMSDFPPDHKLKAMGLQSYFEFAFCSEDAGTLKPHPASFALLASRFGLPESEVLYVGNSRRNDIAGAKAAGMKTAYLGRKKCKEADIVFQSYKNLYEKMEALEFLP
jgi:putative hydrolase of the HAD superfamily